MSAAYRFRQGLRALGSRLRPVDDALAEATLSPALHVLYRRMRRSERQHSLRVLRSLMTTGHTDPDLLVAALLHDVGKTQARFFLPEKVLVVLVRAASPTLYRRWGSASTRGWRRPFAVSVQHPAWGAEMVAAAGASPLAVELIRHHADPPESSTEQTRAYELLRALQAVDDLN
jgi:hypothetical protein